MKPIRHVSAVLLAAAFAAVGCSTPGETLQAKAGSAESAAKPVTTSVATRAESLKRVGEEELVSDPMPKITGPVSFGDGEAAYRAKKYGDATAIFEHYSG